MLKNSWSLSKSSPVRDTIDLEKVGYTKLTSKLVKLSVDPLDVLFI